LVDAATITGPRRSINALLVKTKPLHDDRSRVVEHRYFSLPAGEDLLSPEALVL
jgi:hypothetical protein